MTADTASSGPWRNPCPVCGARQPPCLPGCGFQPDDEDFLPLPLPEPVPVKSGGLDISDRWYPR